MKLIYWGIFTIGLLVRRNTAFTFDRSQNVSSIVDKLLQGYDDNVRPKFGGPPVEVQVSMYALDISSVSEKVNEFTIDFYFRQYWQDPRLAFNSQLGIPYISANTKLLNRIWKPDTFFVNSKHTLFHSATAPNHFLRIQPSGDISYSVRVSVTASCLMSVTNYPFDTQKCNLQIESYGHSAEGIVYSWKNGKNSFGISPEITLNRFKLLGHNNKETSVVLSQGTYSRLSVELYFKRISSFFIINVYIPAILLVIISCLSFLVTSISTRIILNGLTFFMLLTMTASSCSTILSVKALDVFMLFSMLTSALVWVQHIVSAKFAKPQEEVKKDPESGVEKLSISAAFDKYAKIVIPVIYLLGNFIYWTGYCIASSSDISEMISE